MRLISLKLNNMEDTARLAKRLAHCLCTPPGNHVVFLMGSLGSGKTTFVRHLVGNLPGSGNAEVASPSFTLCNIYPTNPVVLHYDLYRLPPGCTDDSLEEALEMVEGARQQPGQQPGQQPDQHPVQQPGQLVLIEWAEHMAQNTIPANRLEIYWHILEHPPEAIGKAGQNYSQVREVILKAEGTAAELDIFKTKL